MKQLHFFHRQELPVPGSHAKAVTYPACEWRAPADYAADVTQHPLNRFVCSWLTSDMAELTRCDEALQAIAQLQQHTRQEWFADGDAFCVDFKPSGVQFNQSNVGPQDTAYWNLPEARFTLSEVTEYLHLWRYFLAQSVAN
jgi:hypothetical protein